MQRKSVLLVSCCLLHQVFLILATPMSNNINGGMHLTEDKRTFRLSRDKVSYKPIDCNEGREFESWWDDNHAIINKCYDQAILYAGIKLKETEDIYACTMTIPCGSKFSNGQGYCNLTVEDCYHETDCIVPKTLKLASSNCNDEDWNAYKPDYCSVGEPGEGCSQIGHVVRLPWIIDSTHKKRFVRELDVEWSQSLSGSDSYYEDKRFSTSGEAKGDKHYCNRNGRGDECISQYSNGINPFRVLNRDSEIPIVHLGRCSSPVYCYGHKEVMVFGEKKMVLDTNCTDCHISCDRKEITLLIPKMEKKLLRVCGRQNCNIMESANKIITIDRSFHQKISDEKMVIEVSNFEKTFNYRLETTCPLIDMCDAIDCNLCRLRLLNPQCYFWYHWLLSLTILYISLLGISLTIFVLKPIVIIVVYMFQIGFRLISKISWMCFHSTKYRVRRVENFATSSEEPLIAPSERIYRTTTFTRKTNVSIPMSFLLYVLFLITFLPLVLMSDVEKKGPECSSILIESVPNQLCIVKGDRYECKVGSLVDVPMISYDQTSCLHFISDKGTIIGELEITPIDLSFKCIKKTEYFTRDAEISNDHIIRCPNAGDCTTDWCQKVDDNTKVEGLADLAWPTKQFCRSGSACWGSGCFYCTESCHVIRYYPRPRTSEVFEVFSCPRWDPSGSFHFKWTGSTQSAETTMSLIHGETKSLNQEIRVTLQMTVQSKLPILSKHFLQGSERTCIIETAPIGQPVPGRIGQIQCESRVDAASLSTKCKMAPNLCNCGPNGANDNCECSQVYISNAFSSENTLPLSIGTDYLNLDRGEAYLKSSAYGSAHIRINTVGKLVGDFEPEQECKVTGISISGCHSCVVGANFTYRCESPKPMTTVLQCGKSINLLLQCDDSLKDKHSRFQSPCPLVELTCKAPCSKDAIHITGSLLSIGLQPINDGSNIQLSPTESLTSFKDWLNISWNFLGWWNTTWLLTIIALAIGVAYLVHKNTTTYLKTKMM